MLYEQKLCPVSFTIEDGLVANHVITILEDREGMLWIGLCGPSASVIRMCVIAIPAMGLCLGTGKEFHQCTAVPHAISYRRSRIAPASRGLPGQRVRHFADDLVE